MKMEIRRGKNRPRKRPGAICGRKLCGQSSGQRLDVRHADAGDQIVSRTGRESAIVSAGDIAEAGAAGKGIDERVQERKRRLAGLGPGFIQQSAEAGPGGSAQAGAAKLL